VLVAKALARLLELTIFELRRVASVLSDAAADAALRRSLDPRDQYEGARVILAGMLSLPKFGPAYKATFDAIYPTLAAKHKIPRYPFFLQGVFGHPRLMLSDGKHPNAAGVRRIVAGILAIVETNLMGARSRVHASSHRATRTRHLRS
jgi:lysophospholipase L1-like esterase